MAASDASGDHQLRWARVASPGRLHTSLWKSAYAPTDVIREAVLAASCAAELDGDAQDTWMVLARRYLDLAFHHQVANAAIFGAVAPDIGSNSARFGDARALVFKAGLARKSDGANFVCLLHKNRNAAAPQAWVVARLSRESSHRAKATAPRAASIHANAHTLD